MNYISTDFIKHKARCTFIWFHFYI